MSSSVDQTDLPSLAHYRIDMGGTCVLVDSVNARAVTLKVNHAEQFSPGPVRVVDLFGSGTDIFVDKIEAISHITPESASLARAWRRAFAERVDVLDPDGSEPEDKEKW